MTTCWVFFPTRVWPKVARNRWFQKLFDISFQLHGACFRHGSSFSSSSCSSSLPISPLHQTQWPLTKFSPERRSWPLMVVSLTWASSGQVTHRTDYFDICYCLNKVSQLTSVWIANRETPLADHTKNVLKISSDGNLVLSNLSNPFIWSTNITIYSL